MVYEARRTTLQEVSGSYGTLRFPFLIESDESLPSVIQRLWDHGVEGTSATLVLVGSSISMMKEKVMSGGSPLHGRFDMRLQLEELSFDAATEFCPDYDPEETVLAWGIFGGTPHYLQAVDDDRPLRENIRDAVLSKIQRTRVSDVLSMDLHTRTTATTSSLRVKTVGTK